MFFIKICYTVYLIIYSVFQSVIYFIKFLVSSVFFLIYYILLLLYYILILFYKIWGIFVAVFWWCFFDWTGLDYFDIFFRLYILGFLVITLIVYIIKTILELLDIIPKRAWKYVLIYPIFFWSHLISNIDFFLKRCYNYLSNPHFFLDYVDNEEVYDFLRFDWNFSEDLAFNNEPVSWDNIINNIFNLFYDLWVYLSDFTYFDFTPYSETSILELVRGFKWTDEF
jgi:hypothetical protein